MKVLNISAAFRGEPLDPLGGFKATLRRPVQKILDPPL